MATRRDVLLASVIIPATFHSSSARSEPLLSVQSQNDFQRVLSPQADRVALKAAEPFVVRAALDPANRILTWNEVAMQLTAVDHARGPTLGYDQVGPHRSSRAIAIAHIAMFDAVNSITKKYQTYLGYDAASPQASINMAIARAAYDTLKVLFPMQEGKITDAFILDMARISDSDQAKKLGDEVGIAVAKNILDARAKDMTPPHEVDVGTQDQATTEPDKYVFVDKGPGIWQPDPISNLHVALGYHWGDVVPFVIKTAANLLPPPKSLTSPEYTEQYKEVRTLGGDPSKGTSTTRKDFETFAAVFWAYDGTPGLCAPPRFYNQLAIQVAEQNTAKAPIIKDASDLSRYLALINTALADTGIAAWKAKWDYKFWRPVTAITAGIDDGNAETTPDNTFYPLGAPATNARGPNFTPPFPAYPSGHAAFGGALFGVLRSIWGEYTSFELISDEFNGLNKGMGPEPVRELMPMRYTRLSQAEWENARSRIWLGIHWQDDADFGIQLGNAVAAEVIAKAFLLRP
jgi:hypothetical protein